MQVSAKSKYVRVSPYKLRPLVNIIRGKTLSESQAYLKTYAVRRVEPIIKVLDSAYANIKNVQSETISQSEIVVKKIFVDQGPVLKYFKPAAMGRASAQRRRLSHITVVLEKE